jgi:putative ABC transport system permease protein
MIHNYFKIALRNLLKNKTFSIINISGLSIGLACCMLIILYTKDEMSYDAFHEKRDLLYQLTCKVTETDGRIANYGISGMVHGPAFAAEIPEIEAFIRIHPNEQVFKKGNETFYEEVTWVDPNFFSEFSFPLKTGNPKTVLKNINSIILTEDIAEKYFGTSNALGKSMEMEFNNKFERFVVSGIAKKTPQNSSIKFKILMSFDFQSKQNSDDHWLNLNFPTYFVINPQSDLMSVEAKMAKTFALKAHNEIIAERKNGFNANFLFGLQPLKSMHLNTDFLYVPEASKPIYTYILSGIALLILLIACINFVNLTIAHSLRRSKEIGIRKVVGSQRKQLIFQFLSESFLLCFIAFALAIIIAQLSLPVFNELSNKVLSLNYLLDYQLIFGFAVLFILTVLGAGFYPSIVLSAFQPVQTLYSKYKFSGKNYLTKSLVVFQFSLATFMIIITIFIYRQFDYLTNKDLGYNDKNLLILSIGQENNNTKVQTFKNELKQMSGIKAVTIRQNGFWATGSRANGKEIPVTIEHVDESYLTTLEIPLKEGRNFSNDFPSDLNNSALVNEAYMKKAGWENLNEGNIIDFFNGETKKIYIIGVVKDYHYGSLREKILPQLFTAQPDMNFGRFLIRVDPDNKTKILQKIEKVYHSIFPYRPFIFNYMDDLNFKLYEDEQKWKKIVAFGAILMIFISILGLFGLTLLSVQLRTKEIGIHKVLGATAFEIVHLLSKNFIHLILYAFVFSIPFAYYVTKKWLENFAFKIEISWQVFLYGAIVIILISVITISFQAIKAALINPVICLKSE